MHGRTARHRAPPGNNSPVQVRNERGGACLGCLIWPHFGFLGPNWAQRHLGQGLRPKCENGCMTCCGPWAWGGRVQGPNPYFGGLIPVQSVYNIHKVKYVFGSIFQITCFSMWKNINIILQLKYVLDFVKGVENFVKGNCSLKGVTRVCHNSIRVLTDSEAVLNFKGPIKARDILNDHPRYGIFQ